MKKLHEIQMGDIGKLVVVHHSNEAFTQGRLQHLETETVEDRAMFQKSGDGNRLVTGFTLTVNGWTRNGLSPYTDIEFL